MDIALRALSARVQVYDYTGGHLRWTDSDEAARLIAAGYEALGKRRVIYAIAQPLPREVVVAIKRGTACAKARDTRARLPTPQPMTTTAEAWDNPPRVLKFRRIPRMTREIFLSALIGRAGVLEPTERCRLREHLREAA